MLIQCTKKLLVEKVIDDYPTNYPVCLEGSGDAPPEDVGGKTGYEDFVNAMADKNHPEHNGYKIPRDVDQEYPVP